MARKIIDIGVIGNDGTGDSIRDSFRKVNDNFRELYSSLGLGERLTFLGLSDTPPIEGGYVGQENAVIAVNPGETGLIFKQLVPVSGISFDFTNPAEIGISAEFSSVSGDSDPALGGNLSARSGGNQYRIQDLVTPISDDEAANKGYTDTKVSLAGVNAINPETGLVEPSYGVMSGPLILARNPEPDDDERFGGLIAATKSYVDNSSFGSSVNLYVATSGQDERPGVSPQLQGRALAYAYRTVEAALKRAEELVLESRLEIGPYKKILTYANGTKNVTLAGIETSPDSGTGFQGTLDLSVDSFSINSVGTNYRVGDTITVAGGVFIEPVRFEVLTTFTNPGGVSQLRQISSGVYTVLPGTLTGVSTNTDSQFGAGLTLDITFRVNSVEITDQGGSLSDPTFQDYGLVSVRAVSSNGIGRDAFGTAEIVGGQIIGITITDRGGGLTAIPTLTVDLPRFLLKTEGQYTDFTGDTLTQTTAAIAGRDIREGLFIRGEESGALAQILSHGPTLGLSGLNSSGDELMDVDVKFGSFKVGEVISYGDVTKQIQITINIESGIYEENLPLKVPQNVSVVGDEFRRVIIRPRAGVTSSSPWAFINFRRDPVIDQLNTAEQLYGYHYLTDSTEPVYPIINNKGNYRGAAELLSLNKTFLQKEVIAWIENQIDNGISPYTGFTYDAALCERDIGLIIDAMVFDLRYGLYNRTISAALKYYASASGLKAITTQLSQTKAAIERLNVLAQLVIKNVEITELYSIGVFPQIVDLAFTAESGVGGSTVDIQAVTNDNPLTIVCTGPHGFTNAQNVAISGVVGMTEINGNDFFVSVVNSTTIELYNDAGLLDPVNATTYTAYSSGGTITNTGGVLGALFTVILDIIDESGPGYGSVNQPLNNEDLDMFLMNDATIIRAITGQGHGGFMMVLDPEGQILAKSPYAQEAASFMRSTGFHRFGGGMFVDGFTGNLQFRLDQDLDSNGLRMQVSGLKRFPQLPASFVVNDVVYRINYVRNYIFNPSGSTAEFVLDETTPYNGNLGSINFTVTIASPAVFTSTDHELQVGAIVVFSTTGALPTGLTAGREYYVILTGLTANTFRVSETPDGDAVNTSGSQSGTHSFVRIFEVLMPGNRSMLSNDYTQVNDMGYGLLATNGGLTEAVSMFTYYCYISYYAINGAQIRSIAGSSSHGYYALVAEGADPLEVPTVANLYLPFTQKATVYALTSATLNQKGGTELYINYTDYLPLPGSEIEINHNGLLTRYAVSSVVLDNLATKRVRLSLSTSGGLATGVPNGAEITVRQNTYVVLTGDVVEVSTRPSTALILRDSSFVYRVLDFSVYDKASGYDQDVFTVASITIANPAVITTTIPHRQQVGTQVTFTTDGTLPAAIDSTQIYYVLSTGLTSTQFQISLTPEGTPVSTLGNSQSGTHTVVPFGLALTQLRENYDYIEINIFNKQPFTGSAIACTNTNADPTVIGSTGHSLVAKDQIRFTASVFPNGIDEDSYYWVCSTSLGANDFLITDVAPIYSTQVGVEGTLTGTQITGLTSTQGILPGMRLIPKAQITGVTAAGDGVTATLTFAQQKVPPYLNNQQIVVASMGSYNGTHTVLTCTTTTLTFASAVTGAAGPGTIDPVQTGTLGSDCRVSGLPPSDTTLVVTGSGLSNGTVVFDLEGDEIAATSVGTGLAYSKVTGDQNATTIAVTDLAFEDKQRIENGITLGEFYIFNYAGRDYEITNYETKDSLGLDYGRITFTPALERSAIFFNSPVALKAAIPVPSQFSLGTLTIRIALTRATGHDFLEIGTGSYADTNYPSEIYGPAVNSFVEAPLYATDRDEEGNTVTKAQVQERGSGRVFFVSTDQFGNFAVGPFFKVDQGTGSVTFSASLALSQLDGLGFKRGAVISEFSVDDTMADASPDAVPTESAVRSYIEKRLGIGHTGNVIPAGSLIPANVGGFLPLEIQVPMRTDLDLGTNQIINLADPLLLTDAVNLRSLTYANIQDNVFTDLKANDILVFTGDQNQAINAEVVGDISLNIDSTANTIDAQINPGVILDSDINASAAIDQTKLVLASSVTTTAASITGVTASGSGSVATLTFAAQSVAPFTIGKRIVVSGLSIAGYNGTYTVTNCTTTTVTYNSTTTGAATGGTVSALGGLASFDTIQFTVTDGYVTVKNNGLSLNKIAKIAQNTVLGNSVIDTNPNDVTAISFSTVVNVGLAIKKSNYTSTGFLRRYNASTANGDTGTGPGNSYEIIDSSSTNVTDTLVVRDEFGDFDGNVIGANQLKLDGIVFADTTSTIGSAGVTQLYNYTGGAAILLGGGPDSAVDRVNYYDNNSHIFRPANGTGTAPITCSTVTASTFTTGAAGTGGTLTGNFSLSTTSALTFGTGNLTMGTGILSVVNGTLRSRTLSTGATATTGTITGQWSLNTGSTLQATYADLAEYYRGDREYEVGTVLIFGGEHEVTVSEKANDTRVAGVVSDAAAYIMNKDCQGHKNLIALQGRVPCKVVGKIRKGDLMVTSKIQGVAVAAVDDAKSGSIIGKAICDYDSDHIGTIEIAVGRT